MELLEDLSYAYSYCVRAERLVDELRSEAEEYDNVALQPTRCAKPMAPSTIFSALWAPM